MKCKLLAIDLDGTLTTNNRKISQNTKNKIIEAQKNGVKIIIASGRPIRGIENYAQELELHKYGGYIMAYNGGVLISCSDKECISSKSVSKTLIPEIYTLAKENNLEILSYKDDSLICEDDSNEMVLQEANINNMHLNCVDSFVDAMNFNPGKCLIVGDPKIIEEQEIIMAQKFRDKINVYRSTPYCLEVVPEGIDKACSLAFLMKKLSINRNEVIAVGDSYNDVGMIQQAGLGVAMANALEAVKQCADYVTLSNDDDGVAHLINKFIFPTRLPTDLPLDIVNAMCKDTLMESLGIKCTLVAEDHVEATMPVDIRTRQPVGILHGGATLALAETVAGFGSNLLCDTDEVVVGMQISGNHISSALEGDTVRAVGTILHKGRSSHLWNVDIFTSRGRLVSTVRVINSILRKR